MLKFLYTYIFSRYQSYQNENKLFDNYLLQPPIPTNKTDSVKKLRLIYFGTLPLNEPKLPNFYYYEVIQYRPCK